MGYRMHEDRRRKRVSSSFTRTMQGTRLEASCPANTGWEALVAACKPTNLKPKMTRHLLWFSSGIQHYYEMHVLHDRA